jgi:hypothetical protein
VTRATGPKMLYHRRSRFRLSATFVHFNLLKSKNNLLFIKNRGIDVSVKLKELVDRLSW